MNVAAWLSGLGLEQYERAFRDHDVDVEVLPELTAEDLVGLGVNSLGHRRKLLAAIATLRRGPASDPTVGQGRVVPVEPSDTAKNPAEAERRQLTVMFADLVGSIALSRQLDPEDAAGLIRAYQNTVAGELLRWEGHVAKFMGDGVLCYFGWPRAQEDAAERAVRAGLAVARAVGALQAPDGSNLAVRIGIATGIVVVGELVGEGTARERAVLGDTPNLAARLQASAQPGEVMIAEGTRRLLGDLFVLANRDNLTLKGYDLPVHAYGVVAAGVPESRFEALHGTRLTPLVGRERELAALLDAWGRARDGIGQVVLIVGEPGIGKSRLIEALRSQLAGGRADFLDYQGSPLRSQSVLHPFASELERTAGFHRKDGAAEQRCKLETLLEGRMGNAAAAAAPLLASLLNLPADGRLSPDMTPQQLKARTLAALVAQVEALTQRRPLLLVFEDAHWADPSSLELLAILAERVATLPILLLVSYRPEFAPRWGDLPHVVSVMLDRLNRHEAAALAERVAGAGRLPPAAMAQIVARADGVPLFVEELARTMLELDPREEADAGRPGVRAGTPAEVPSTLHDLLLARLDRLGNAKEVLQIGATIGREFPRELVATVSQLEAVPLDEALDRAAGSGLVARQGAGRTATYWFRHALIQEVAYASMLRSRRRALHAQIARLPELRGARPEWLARHYAEAGETDRAAALWLEAGRQAKATFAASEAATHLANCLRAASDAEGRASDQELRRIRAGALVMLGDLASLSEDLAAADRHYRAASAEAPDADLCRRVENKRHRPRLATRDGAQIAFYEHGSGDTALLFVSTQAIGLATFQPILERLCDEFRIVTVDPRGSGGSDPLTRPYPVTEHAADVRAVISALNIPKLVGVGISMGANLLLRIAHTAPQILRGIVSIGGPTAGQCRPYFSKDWMELRTEMKRTEEVEPMLRLHVRRIFSEPEMHEMLETIVGSRLKLPRETLLSFFLDDAEGDVTAILPTIQTPTLVMHGRDDRLVSFAAAELMTSLLPNAKLHGFEGKGHLPIFTATSEFCEVLRAFVRDQLPAA